MSAAASGALKNLDGRNVGTQAAIYVLSIFEGFNSVFAARVLLMSFSGSVLMISFFFPSTEES